MDEVLSNDVEYSSSSDDMADDQSLTDISNGDESLQDSMGHPQQEDQVEGDTDPTQTFNSALPGKCMANTNQQTIPTLLPRRHDPDASSTSGMMTGITDLQSPNQGADLMHRIPLNPQFQTDPVDLTLPKEVPTPQAAVGRVVPPAVAHQQYQQLSRQQQLRLHPISLCFPNPLRYSSIPMYFPFSHITPPRQPSSQMNLGHLTAQRNPVEIKKLEDKLQSFHITKQPRSESDSKIDGVLQKAHSGSSAGEVPDEKMSRNDCYDSDEEINVVDDDDDTNEDPSAPLNLAPLGSITSKPTTKEQSDPTPPNAIKDLSNDAPCSSGMMTGVKSLKTPNQVDYVNLALLADVRRKQTTNEQFVPTPPTINNEPSHDAPCSSGMMIGAKSLQSLNQVEVEKYTTDSFNSVLSGLFITKTNQQTLPTRFSRNDDPSHDDPICSYMVTGVTDMPSPNQRPDYSALERLKLTAEQLLQQHEDKNLQGAQSSTFIKSIQVPKTMQGEVSLQNRRPDYSALERLKLTTEQLLQQYEYKNLQGAQSSSFIKSSQVPKTMQGEVSLQNRRLVRRSKKRIPERMKLKKEMQELGEKFKNRRLELDQTQKDVARQLNKLCRKHNVDLRLLPSSISQLENQKLGLRKFLKLKPQLEFWMENRNTEDLHSLANKPESTVRGRRTKNHMPKVSREYLMKYFQQNPNTNLQEMKKLAILIKRDIKFVCNWFYWQKSKKKERNVKDKKKKKNAVINQFTLSDTAHATSSLNTISSTVCP